MATALQSRQKTIFKYDADCLIIEKDKKKHFKHWKELKIVKIRF